MAASPGKFGSPSGWLLVDGFNLTAAKLQGLTVKITSLMKRTDGLGDAWEEHTPVGISRVALAQEGAYWDTSTGQIHDALEDHLATSPQSAQRVVCLGFAGHTIGAPFVGIQGTYSQAYEVLAERDDLQKANVEYLVSGQLDRGVILQGLAAQTANWNTEGADSVDHAGESTQLVIPITSSSVANPSVITTPVPHGLTSNQTIVIAGHNGSTPDINGARVVTVLTSVTFSIPVNVTVGGTGGTLVQADTPNGGVGYQHVTAFSGLTNFVGTIRDSPDDVTYADLITFATVTSAPVTERATVAGTVDRHLAFRGAVTGTGSLTVFAGFARS